jgi:hypothetical protein
LKGEGMELDDNKIEKLMQASINMRDKIAELEHQISDIKVQRDKVDMALNEACRTLNVSSLKTKAGTISRILKTKYWTTDWNSMYDFILENKLPEFFEKKLVQSSIKEYLEQNPDKHPPGLQATQEYTVRITKSRTKEEV